MVGYMINNFDVRDNVMLAVESVRRSVDCFDESVDQVLYYT